MAILYRNSENNLVFDKDKFGVKIAALAASCDTIGELWWLTDAITSTVYAAMLDRNYEIEKESENE